MYFTIGGRRTKSGLYRVTYVGKESTDPLPNDRTSLPLHDLRRKLEQFHGKKVPEAIDFAWPYLNHPDRFIRYAARIAIEFQEPKLWQEKALAETDPTSAINALLALVRVRGFDPFHHPNAPKPDSKLKEQIVDALVSMPWDRLSDEQRLQMLRVYQIFFNRFGPPNAEQRHKVLAQVDPHYPSNDRLINGEACPLLVYLEAPNVSGENVETHGGRTDTGGAVGVWPGAACAEDRMDDAATKEYFTWLRDAANFKGGNSLGGFLANIRNDAVSTLTSAERKELRPILDAKPSKASPIVSKPRSMIKNYKMEDLIPVLETRLLKRDFNRGRKLFGEAQCFSCHRFDNEGGAEGPDLTSAAGRFNARDLLESIVEPSKVISDQYAAVVVETTDGKQYTGRIINHNGDSMMLNTNMLDPNAITTIDRRKIEAMEISKTSMMPTGLLDSFKEDEILDLMAYLLSRGDRKNGMFK